MSPQELVQELNSAGGEEKKQEFLQKRNKLIIFLQSHENISNTWSPDPLQMHGLDWRLIWFFISLIICQCCPPSSNGQEWKAYAYR